MITFLLHVLRLLPFLFGGHRQLAVENLALRQQLAVYKRTTARPKLRTTDRLFWIGLARVWAGWRQPLVIVTADTVLRWQRRRFREYWSKLSGRSTGGRPAVHAEIKTLITRMATANPLCLPLIRPIGSRRSPEVFVMEPTHAGHLHHPALARRLHTPWLGCVLGQRQVGPGPVVVVDVLRQDPQQMPFAEHDDMVQAFPSNRSNHALGIGVLPGRARRNDHFPDVQGLGLTRKSFSIHLVSVTDQMPWLLQPARLDQLSPSPIRGRMFRAIEMHQPRTVVARLHDPAQHPKGRFR